MCRIDSGVGDSCFRRTGLVDRMIDEAAIRLRWDAVGSRLDERGRRLFAAAEVRSAGRGGLVIVSKISGLARSTINRGKQDSMHSRCRRGRFAVPVAVAGRFARTIRGWSPRSSGCWNPRPWATRCAH